ncbi:MAG: hypothetical protein M3081_05230 [Gemmatimonadota bacterium]|nr:hypothetical protein [Gemmatimonadota bacterium]
MRRLPPLAMLIAAGCASAGPPADVGGVSDRIVMGDQFSVVHGTTDKGGRSVTIPVPPRKLQRAIADTYKALDLDLNTVDLDNGVFGATEVVKKRLLGGAAISTYLNCGSSFSGPRANEDRITITILTTVRADDKGGSIVVTNIQNAQAQDISGGNSRDPVQCGSIGTLEGRINNAIAAATIAKP